MYLALKEDVDILLQKYSKDPWEMTCGEYCQAGIFFDVAVLMKVGDDYHLHLMDVETLKFTSMEELYYPINLSENSRYKLFIQDLASLMDKYANKEWPEMAHGLPTLRFFNRCLRLKSGLLLGFEVKIMQIRERYYNRCVVCGFSEKTMKCKGCSLARYCSVGCQKKDWSNHKNKCNKK
jgi:hypothetical protein